MIKIKKSPEAIPTLQNFRISPMIEKSGLNPDIRSETQNIASLQSCIIAFFNQYLKRNCP